MQLLAVFAHPFTLSSQNQKPKQIKCLNQKLTALSQVQAGNRILLVPYLDQYCLIEKEKKNQTELVVKSIGKKLIIRKQSEYNNNHLFRVKLCSNSPM